VVRKRAIIALVLAFFAVGAGPAAAATKKHPPPAPKKVPAGFVGVVGDGPLLDDPSVDLGAQLDSMVASGVQSMRTSFNWAAAQPYQSFADVPQDQRSLYQDEGGVPTDYSETDRVVTAAAQRRITVLPVVQYAPDWDARHPGQTADGHPELPSSPPRDPQPFADFSAALVRRYGPGGEFWAEHPELVAQPIRYWQIWNEPNITPFWSDQPFADDYVALLRAAHDSILAADPGARIVLAGLTNDSWNGLQQIYDAGGQGLFDVVAFHPFTHTVAGVKTILQRGRNVMARNGDGRKPLWVTELSWTSAKGQTTMRFGNEETEKGQASKLTSAFTMLATVRQKLRIERVYWYTWLSLDQDITYPFDWAGLSVDTPSGTFPKPALPAFRHIALKLERCRSKRARADRCAR
jgi:hypothetical protein